jgi:hypothetical protein
MTRKEFDHLFLNENLLERDIEKPDKNMPPTLEEIA